MSFNRVLLLGRLGKDPEVRYTASNVAVGNFSVATSEYRKDQSGNWAEHTEWHNIVVFGKTADNVKKFLKKGSEVFIEGRLQTRKWTDKEGRDRYTTEILGDNVRFVGGKGRGDSMGGDSASAVGSEPSSASPSSAEMNAGKELISSLQSADSLPISAGGQAAAAPAPAQVPFADDDIPF